MIVRYRGRRPDRTNMQRLTAKQHGIAMPMGFDTVSVHHMSRRTRRVLEEEGFETPSYLGVIYS